MNTNRNPVSSGPPTPKKLKVDAEKHTYPYIEGNEADEVSIARTINLLKVEMTKTRPRYEIVVDLMKQKFIYRRRWILSESRTVSSVCMDYPILSKALYVSKTFWSQSTCIVGYSGAVDKLPTTKAGIWHKIVRNWGHFR